jgi:Na+/H+ antiporter NhaA
MALATVVALVWANSPWRHSYTTLWATHLVIRIGDAGIAAPLRVWVNEGLMTLFFLVVGLEAKRQLDLGELPSANASRCRSSPRSGGCSCPP